MEITLEGFNITWNGFGMMCADLRSIFLDMGLICDDLVITSEWHFIELGVGMTSMEWNDLGSMFWQEMTLE